MSAKRRKSEQLSLAFPAGRGGKREGAGRKPRLGKRGPLHEARPDHDRWHPVHVTMRAVRDVPSLRSFVVAQAIGKGFHAARKKGRRIVQFSIQADHIHLIVEADDRRDLITVARGTAIRLAKRINHALRRKGMVFVDRYHTHTLTKPTTIRRALVYVLQNWRKHCFPSEGIDPYSSGRWFEGWREPPPPPDTPSPVSAPATWLADKGWRRFGPVDITEGPRPGETIDHGPRRRPARQARAPA